MNANKNLLKLFLKNNISHLLQLKWSDVIKKPEIIDHFQGHEVFSDKSEIACYVALSRTHMHIFHCVATQVCFLFLLEWIWEEIGGCSSFHRQMFFNVLFRIGKISKNQIVQILTANSNPEIKTKFKKVDEIFRLSFEEHFKVTFFWNFSEIQCLENSNQY